MNFKGEKRSEKERANLCVALMLNSKPQRFKKGCMTVE